MKKRLLSLLLVLAVVFSFSLSAFATDTGIDIIDDPLSYYFENQMLGVQKGTGVTLVCPKCDYKVVYTGGTLVTCPYDGEALVLADLAGVHAEKAPSGVGRKDLPGYCDTGDGTSTPQVDSNGKFVDGWVYVTPEHDYSYIAPGYDGYYAGCEHYTRTITNKLNASFTCSSLPFLAAYSNSSSGFTDGYFGNHFYFYWKVNVPAYSYVRFLSFGQYTFNSVLGGKTTTTKNTFSNSRALNTEYYMGSETLFFFDEFGNFSNQTYFSATYSALPVIQYKPPQFNNISYNTNLTINKNTWNGNIYTDNSTNLTYIYPQYTTINEKNETVTNISNNPIIYNNETKQYYTYDSVTNNYYYITYETTPTPTPSPSPAPAPTWTPGGGATRGGGVGRHPSDTDAADWTLHYYILNNRRYDAYYALKKTEVNTETKLPWVDNKKYISTTQIPIANGQYTVSVPDGVYWRVWQWDEASQTLTGVNSSNWHSTINNFLFNATGEYIFEFCKADGSDFNTAKDVTLKLKNDKITEYEPGGALDTEPVTPETQNLIIPKMNSNTFTDEHGTWIASGSSKYSDVFDFFRAFDRSTSEIWETNQSPSHLQIEIPDPKNYYVDGYIMRISKFTNRYAKEWTLQGSDDGKTWDDLDTQKDQNLSDMQEHKYTLTLRKAYKYYRLNMSNYASSMCSLSHFNRLVLHLTPVQTRHLYPHRAAALFPLRAVILTSAAVTMKVCSVGFGICSKTLSNPSSKQFSKSLLISSDSLSGLWNELACYCLSFPALR